MITYHRTSLLTSQAQTLVNTVNTVGVMGKGLAAAFKKKHPDMFKAYKVLCDEKKFQVGQLWLWKGVDQWVLNFPTKAHWRNPSKIEYVEAGLKKFVNNYEQKGIREIAFPRLGCGNGGLDWEEVRPLMEHYLRQVSIPVYIHDHVKNIGQPEHEGRDDMFKHSKSFNELLDNMRTLIHREQGDFTTVIGNKNFRADLSTDNELRIQRHGRRITISEEDMFGVWNLLLKGPISKKHLAGIARDEAYYVFPVLAQLPYIRLIKVETENRSETLAIELLQNREFTQISGNNEGGDTQGQLQWA